jgi:DNA-binding PadR family transcriptional regulator
MSVLKQAVLGSVVERPDHGYRVALRLQQRLGWKKLTRQAVYLQLDRLATEGLVRKTAADGPSSEEQARRRPYQATNAGVESFDAWMRAPCALEAARDELYTKIALSKRHHLPELIALTRQLERDCLTRLRALERPSLSASSSHLDPWASAAEMLLVNREAATLQTEMRWLQRARAVMETLREDRPGGVAGAPQPRS